MDRLLYCLARLVIVGLQALPLSVVARLGRSAGALAYWIDARHRRVVQTNLALCFGTGRSAREVRALARENFRRIGENYCCAVKTASMSEPEIRRVLTVVGAEKLCPRGAESPPESRILGIGHFGNFELYVHLTLFTPGLQGVATYRALRQPALNRLMQSLRRESGCLFFERRSDADKLRLALNRGGILLGLLADQHAGDRGLRLPFLGRDCSTSAAPALLALRYGCPLFTAICYRTALGRWQVEVGDEIPIREQGQPRSSEAIMLDVNRAFETAVRRDPANWFWVHNRWKPAKPARRSTGTKP